MAFLVTERSHEFGVRMAMGAERSSIIRLVLGGGRLFAPSNLGLGLGSSEVASSE